MKKLVILIALLFLASSCAVKMRTVNIYERQYFNEKESLQDLYSQTSSYGLDSIPLSKWSAIHASSYDGFILQRSTNFVENEKTSYHFIYTVIVHNEGLAYLFKVTMNTNDKKLLK